MVASPPKKWAHLDTVPERRGPRVRKTASTHSTRRSMATWLRVTDPRSIAGRQDFRSSQGQRPAPYQPWASPKVEGLVPPAPHIRFGTRWTGRRGSDACPTLFQRASKGAVSRYAPKKSFERTDVDVPRLRDSVVAIHAASRWWLSFLRWTTVRALLRLVFVSGCVAVLGCRTQGNRQPEDVRASRPPASRQPEKVTQMRTWTETDLDDEQRKALKQWNDRLNTGNSAADLDRLKDSLQRWDELFVNPAPPQLKPVFEILRERLKGRIVELEGRK